MQVNIITNALTNLWVVLAGIVMFSEPASREFACGVVLTMAGLLLMATNEPTKSV